MGYFGPEFANISSGWYWTTDRSNYAPVRKVIDSLWTKKWDAFLLQLLADYGTFYTAFLADVQEQFERENHLEAHSLRYFEYYVASRAWLLPKTRAIWADSHKRAEGQNVSCATCGDRQPITDIHPSVVKSEWPDLRHCYRCHWTLRQWAAHGIVRADALLKSCIERARRGRDACAVCGQRANEFQPNPRVADFEESAYVLYLNGTLRVCTACYRNIFADHPARAREADLIRLRNFVRYLGRIPQQEFRPLVFLYHSRREMLLLLAHIRRLRDAAGYKKEYGSFLAALIAAGLLPAGARKMAIGTMALAEDGHVCLSLAEKSIDDFLSRNGVPHRKEVLYPGSHYRTDWEVTTSGVTQFIEYLGLAGQTEYDRKTERKQSIARENGIEFVGLLPSDNWEGLLRQRLSLKDAPNKSLEQSP